MISPSDTNSKKYELDIKEHVEKIFFKLSKKNQKQLIIINKKIEEIRNNPNNSYKYLRKPLQQYQRTHIDKHFVLIFKIHHDKRLVEIYSFNHHDVVYKKT